LRILAAPKPTGIFPALARRRLAGHSAAEVRVQGSEFRYQPRAAHSGQKSFRGQSSEVREQPRFAEHLAKKVPDF